MSLAEGETLGVVGESGSGKSVTGFSILGLVDAPGRVVAGQVLFNGRDVAGLADEDMRRLRGRQAHAAGQRETEVLVHREMRHLGTLRIGLEDVGRGERPVGLYPALPHGGHGSAEMRKARRTQRVGQGRTGAHAARSFALACSERKAAAADA